MTDFFQNGAIATFHRLNHLDPDVLEDDLEDLQQKRPVALVLPCLYEELQSPALEAIVDQLRQIPYFHTIVVALGNANAQEFRHAQESFAPLQENGAKVRVLWNEGPRLQEVYRRLEAEGLTCGGKGKGRATWAAYGYLIAGGETQVIVQHDADIITYERDLPTRLAYPVVDPETDYVFCKGYYARHSDRLHGRLTRLFVTPLIRSLRDVMGDQDVLKYLDSFRYPLAGEFALDTDLAKRMHLPADWGLELGILAECYRVSGTEAICQVDIADNYDHKHQDLGDGPDQGLQKMAMDVSRSILETLAKESGPLRLDLLDATVRAYRSTAHEFLDRYALEARLNGLHHGREQEAQAIECFGQAYVRAANHHLTERGQRKRLPSWRQVQEQVPHFLPAFEEAVDADNCDLVRHPRASRQRPMVPHERLAFGSDRPIPHT